jgi:hypothetical protein
MTVLSALPFGRVRNSKGTNIAKIYRSEFNSWRAMLDRCRNPKAIGYSRYGKRGITVCDRWLMFRNFIEDMGLKPTPAHTIDRIDNDKGYYPENCQWATRQQQADNSSRTHLITLDGETHSIATWARRYGAIRRLVNGRILKGWSIRCALTVRLKKGDKHAGGCQECHS